MTESTTQDHEQLREAVRQRYAAAATKVSQEHAWAESALPVINTSGCCGHDASCSCSTDTKSVITSDLYAIDEVADLPSAAVAGWLSTAAPVASTADRQRRISRRTSAIARRALDRRKA